MGQIAIAELLAALGALIGSLFGGLFLMHLSGWPKRLSHPWLSLSVLFFLTIGLFISAGLVREIADGGDDGSDSSNTVSLPIESPTPQLTPTPLTINSGPFAVRCDDALSVESCTTLDPARPDVTLDIATVNVDRNGNLRISVTLRNGSQELVFRSDYKIEAWYAVDNAGRTYHVDPVLSDDAIADFLYLSESRSASGFIHLGNPNPAAMCITLYVPPFQRVGPLPLGEGEVCQ